MGYVDGPSLRARLAEHPLVPREAAELILQVARAVDHAHIRHGPAWGGARPANRWRSIGVVIFPGRKPARGRERGGPRTDGVGPADRQGIANADPSQPVVCRRLPSRREASGDGRRLRPRRSLWSQSGLPEGNRGILRGDTLLPGCLLSGIKTVESNCDLIALSTGTVDARHAGPSGGVLLRPRRMICMSVCTGITVTLRESVLQSGSPRRSGQSG